MKKELSKIYLWEQYKRNDALVGYFDFLRSYLNENYKDLFYKNNEAGEFLKEFSINEAESEYLQYYLENIYNMLRPHFLVEKSNWDTGYMWDDTYKWDMDGKAELIPISLLKKIFKFVYGLNYNSFNIPNFAGMLAEFCDIKITDIKIEIDSSRIKTFIITLPACDLAVDFRTLYATYKNIFNLPIGFSMILKIT